MYNVRLKSQIMSMAVGRPAEADAPAPRNHIKFFPRSENDGRSRRIRFEGDRFQWTTDRSPFHKVNEVQEELPAVYADEIETDVASGDEVLSRSAGSFFNR